MVQVRRPPPEPQVATVAAGVIDSGRDRPEAGVGPQRRHQFLCGVRRKRGVVVEEQKQIGPGGPRRLRAAVVPPGEAQVRLVLHQQDARHLPQGVDLPGRAATVVGDDAEDAGKCLRLHRGNGLARVGEAVPVEEYNGDHRRLLYGRGALPRLA